MKKQKTKVGFIFNHSFFLGGGEHSLFALIESLKNSNFEPIGIVPEAGEVMERLKMCGITYAICPLSSLRQDVRKYFIGDVKTLATALRSYGIRIIHANGSRACLYGGIVGRLLGIPVIWHVRETIRDHVLYDGLLGCLAKRIVCVSQAIADKRFSRFGILLAGKITLVHNGVDPDKLSMDKAARRITRDALGIEDEDTLISIVGNYIPLKGHDFLIRGFSEACNHNKGSRLKLLCVGRFLDPDYHKVLLSLVQELCLENHVILNDYTTDVSGILSATDIFALPSEREGFSRSLLEAMCVGLPVIASRIDEIGEAVEDKSGGVLVDYGDVAGLAKAILFLYQEPEIRANMGMKNRARFLKHFTMDIHRKSFEHLYSTLIENGKNP